MLGVCYTQNVRRMQTLLSMSDGRNLLSLFLRDWRKPVLYSSKTVVERFSKPYILTRNTVRQRTQPMTGEPIFERQRRFYNGEDDRRRSLGTDSQGRGGRVYLWDRCGLPGPLDSGGDALRDAHGDCAG